jgi:hypothetical protein
MFGSPDAAKDKPVPSPAKTEQPKRQTNYKNALPEILDTFNLVESDHNLYKSLYAGAAFKEGVLIVYVTDQWNYVSGDIKQAYMNQIGTLWTALSGTRGADFFLDDFEFKLVHKLSGRTVATWDYLFGPKIIGK